MQTIETGSTVDINQKRRLLNTLQEADIPETPVRNDWRAKYALGLVVIDWIIGFLAAAAALALRFGGTKTEPFLLDYRLLTLLFPLPWLAVLALNRAYESRHLFVGTDEASRGDSHKVAHGGGCRALPPRPGCVWVSR